MFGTFSHLSGGSGDGVPYFLTTFVQDEHPSQMGGRADERPGCAGADKTLGL